MRISKYNEFIKESSDQGEDEEYSFDDLSKEAQANAIEKNRDYEIERYDWPEPIIEGFEEEMLECGLTRVKCEFEGFNNQGDGASFTARSWDNKKFVKEALGMKDMPDEVLDNIYIEIVRNSSRHVHYNTISADVSVDGDEEIEMRFATDFSINVNVQDQCDLIEPKATEWARNKSKDLFNRLETYYEELQSDDNVAEFLRSSGYKFDKNGNIY
jgi:hypothetical protein